jgi:xanthine dehydrogenase small subunit
MRSEVVFYLNGERHSVADERAGWMLADYLRYGRGLTGTKIVCAEGDCGACTVLRFFPNSGRSFLPINACITLVAQMDGSSLVTVDGLSVEGTILTPVQRAMVESNGSQCGFCTPGFVMALTGLVEKKLERKAQTIAEQEAKNALTGNLCRCTGYDPILKAATSLKVSECPSIRAKFCTLPQSQTLKKVIADPVAIETETFSFYAPTELKDAAKYLRKHPETRMIAAGTDLGVVHNKRKIRLNRTLSLHLVRELYEIDTPRKGRLRVGARVTLSELRDAVKKSVPELARFLDLFASPQIKNFATLAGNVCNASPIADTPPFLLAANATVHAAGARGKRTIALEDFYLAYRKTALRSDEVVIAIEFDEPQKNESLALYKVSQRKDLDISTVNAAFRIRWKDSSRKQIQDLRIAMGGMAATPLRLKKTEKALLARDLDAPSLARALTVFHSEMEPISDLRGSAGFRRVASENLFQKFFHEHAGTALR